MSGIFNNSSSTKYNLKKSHHAGWMRNAIVGTFSNVTGGITTHTVIECPVPNVDFYAVKLIFANIETYGQQVYAEIGSQSDLSSAANIVNNSQSNSVVNSGVYTTVTANNGQTPINIPPASGNDPYGVTWGAQNPMPFATDIIPLQSVPRTDGSQYRALSVRCYFPYNSATPLITTNSILGYNFAPAGPKAWSVYQTGANGTSLDGGSLANFTTTSILNVNNPIIGAVFYTHERCINMFFNGDSITAGAGITNHFTNASSTISGTTLTFGTALGSNVPQVGSSVTGTGVAAGTVLVSGSGQTWTVNISQTVASTNITISNANADWPYLTSQELTNSLMPVCAINNGWAGQTSSQYVSRLRNWMPLYDPDIMVYSAFTPNETVRWFRGSNYLPPTNLGTALKAAANIGAYPVIWTGLPTAFDGTNTSSSLVAAGAAAPTCSISSGIMTVTAMTYYTWGLQVGDHILTSMSTLSGCTISGTTLTITSGTPVIGQSLVGVGVTPCTITAGSGTSWTISVSQTVSTAITMYSYADSGVYITGFITGVGGVGTYSVNNSSYTLASQQCFTFNDTYRTQYNQYLRSLPNVSVIDIGGQMGNGAQPEIWGNTAWTSDASSTPGLHPGTLGNQKMASLAVQTIQPILAQNT